jgi:RNA polymerase sigma-70 factor (ECF subfamily)
MIYNDKGLNSIIKRLIRDDKKALDEIYNFFYPKLYAFAKSFLKVEDDINDILQDVFIKLWLNRKKIKNTETFNSYLFTIAKNAIVSYFREKSKNQKFELRIMEMATAGGTEYNNELEYKDLKENLDIIIDQLPEKRKLVFKLSREEGLSNREIAEKLGISKKTVEDHMLYSLRFIRKKLKNIEILTLLFMALFL